MPALNPRRASGRPPRPFVGVTLMFALVATLLVALLGLAACGSGVTTSTVAPSSTTASPPTTVAKLDKITLVAPPGPMAIPLAYMAVNNALADVANKTEIVIWENADQLKAMVAGKQGDFVTMPSNNAATFYNKGLQLQLLNIAVWNITYLVTSQPKVESFKDIEGQSLVVSLQGSVPDVMFQYMAKKEGLDPEKDFKLQYATDPTQAGKLLVAGQVDNAVLSEALATAVVLQTKDTDRKLRKAFAFDKAWQAATGTTDQPPIAGTVATANVMDKPAVLAAFAREYAKAVDWMLANPEEAGKLLEVQLPQLGVKAGVMTASLKSITWKFTPAADARPQLEAFYKALTELSPQVIGGTLPDDGFYYQP